MKDVAFWRAFFVSNTHDVSASAIVVIREMPPIAMLTGTALEIHTLNFSRVKPLGKFKQKHSTQNNGSRKIKKSVK